MPGQPTESSKQKIPRKPWRRKRGELPIYVKDNLYQVYHYLRKRTRERVGLLMKIPVFIQDPSVAMENPMLGVQEIEVRLEAGFSDGPTSSRVAVIDFDGDKQSLRQPIAWNPDVGWFHHPAEDDEQKVKWLLDAPPDISRRKKLTNKLKAEYKQFVDQAVNDPYFHQLNVWAVVQRVLEFYEEPQALGRPVPWGFNGNRLLVVPHAGFGQNAFYDQRSKSLQFYYFGDVTMHGYTCLSHDIIAHETGHAILDGIRPMYNQLSSVQTAAFHEFIGDLTAILLALFNNDIRRFVAEQTQGNLGEADVLANIAEQFGEEVEGRPYLRTAVNPHNMETVKESLSPHTVSEVMTGAMFKILIGIAQKHMEKNMPEDIGDDDFEESRVVTPAQALWWAADRFRRVALQPLDLCPPCDIQFIDYAKAVIRNDILTNPVDEQGYRDVMLNVFHERKLCVCGYIPGKDLPEDCQFQDALEIPDLRFIYHDIGRVSRSRTAAYYFLSDNRETLRIPPHQDVIVVDLYDNNKYGAAAERLPREVVLEYAWQEQVLLKDDPEKNLSFGDWNRKIFDLDCGGTLVFDDRGNLLSWFRKPGTEHITEMDGQDIKARKTAWENDPKGAKKPTKQELGELADLEEGRKRKAAVKAYLSALIQRGLVGVPQPEKRFKDGVQPVLAIEDNGIVRFETTPHLRKSDFDTEEEGWTVNY